MKKEWLLAISLALVIAVGGLAGCNSESPGGTDIEGLNINNQQEGIWVSGQGVVTVTPDIATLRLGVEAQATSVAAAQSQATETMDDIMAALTDNGVVKKDIQTQYFSIRKVTKWDRDKEEEAVVGYRVTNKVNAKIREIDKTGTIIDAVATAGGDLTRINNIYFSVDDLTAYHKEARDKAMADAKNKAEQLADLSGVKLGKPTYISENLYFPPPIYKDVPMMEGAPAPAPTTPISPGEMEVTLNVQVAYAILN